MFQTKATGKLSVSLIATVSLEIYGVQILTVMIEQAYTRCWSVLIHCSQQFSVEKIYLPGPINYVLWALILYIRLISSAYIRSIYAEYRPNNITYHKYKYILRRAICIQYIICSDAILHYSICTDSYVCTHIYLKYCTVKCPCDKSHGSRNMWDTN